MGRRALPKIDSSINVDGHLRFVEALEPAHDPVRAFAPAGKKNGNTAHLVALPVKRISIRAVKNNRDAMAFDFSVGREHFQQRFPAALQVLPVQPTQFRRLANEVVTVDNDVNRHKIPYPGAGAGPRGPHPVVCCLSGQQPQQAVQVIVPVKFDFNPAFVPVPLYLDLGTVMARKFLGDPGQVNVGGAGRPFHE